MTTIPPATGDLPPNVPDSEGSAVQTTETLWRIYAAVNEWIRFADAKAGAILTANGVLAGVTITALQGNRGFLTAHRFTCASVILELLSITASTVFCLWCILPALRLRADPANSLIYFGHIARQYQGNPHDYTAALQRKLASPVDGMHEIGKQVWAVAKVASSKNGKIIWAVWGLAGGLLFGLGGCSAAWFGW